MRARHSAVFSSSWFPVKTRHSTSIGSDFLLFVAERYTSSVNVRDEVWIPLMTVNRAPMNRALIFPPVSGTSRPTGDLK